MTTPKCCKVSANCIPWKSIHDNDKDCGGGGGGGGDNDDDDDDDDDDDVMYAM